MKFLKGIGILMFLLLVAHLYYLHTMTATEKYNEDDWLSKQPVKRAVIITAHDDDAYSFSGTIFKLIQEGWEIRQISFQRKEAEKNKLFYDLAARQGLKSVDLICPDYRRDTATNAAPYMPLPLDSFNTIFSTDEVYSKLSQLLDKYQPSVIFSLDDSIGGYGHPDHVFISKQAVRYFNEHRNQPGISLQRIYQAVFPPSMAESIMIKNSWVADGPYPKGKKVYHCNGMPIPQTGVTITAYGAEKKDYMNSFAEKDRKNIAKFSPYYNWYPAWLYFRMFDKEYFRVVS